MLHGDSGLRPQPRAGHRSRRRHDQTDARTQIKAMADIAGVPVERRRRRADRQFDRPGVRRLCADRRHAAVRSRAGELSSLVQTGEGREMSADPALLSLTAVAQAIAQKKVSSREVTQSCLDRIAQWQPTPQRLHGDRSRSGARRRRRRRRGAGEGRQPAARCTACRWRTRTCITTPATWSTCGSKIRRDFVATTTSTALQRLKDAGTIRLGSLQMVGIRLWADRPQRAFRRGA